MFTGIVEELGQVVSITKAPPWKLMPPCQTAKISSGAANSKPSCKKGHNPNDRPKSHDKEDEIFVNLLAHLHAAGQKRFAIEKVAKNYADQITSAPAKSRCG